MLFCVFRFTFYVMKRFLIIILVSIIALSGTAIYQYIQFSDGRLHIIFCDVGQGDAIVIKTPEKQVILVDGGPDQSVLDCLSNHLPFWERTIDLVLLSHPHADHLVGFLHVFDRFSILSFATENLSNKSSSFQELLRLITTDAIPMRHVATGDRWRLASGVTITIAGPTNAFIFKKNPDGFITNSAESASLATLVSYGNFSILLTGDAPVDEMHDVGESLGSVAVLQIPHHGSTTGLDRQVLEDLHPQFAAISVGAHNRYGHPKKQTLNLLSQFGIPLKRTDKDGDIEIISDGKKWWVN